MSHNKTLDIYEEIYYAKNELVMGIDEAGKGALCGPMAVACCVFPIGYKNEEIYDSKKLSPKKREALYETIIKDALYYRVELVSNKYIDEVNIAMADIKTTEFLAKSYDVKAVITDYVKIDVDDRDVIVLAKADSKSINVAAASILAKVTRDHVMMGYDMMYPEYGFKKHKGYGTKSHMENIKEYGALDFYRFSFGDLKKYKKI